MNGYLAQSACMSGVYDRSNGSSGGLSFDGSEGHDSMDDGNQSLVEWLNKTLPYLNLPREVSEIELRVCLMDGTVLCSLLNQLSPGSIKMGSCFEPASIKVERFLAAMDEMALPRFEFSDLEQGDMVLVLQSLKALQASFSDFGFDKNSICARRRWSMPEDRSEEAGNNFNEGFQFKGGSYTDLSDAKLLELLKSNGLQNTSTRALFDMLDMLLDENSEKMNVSHGMASLLRTIVQLIEQRVSTQAENFENQNILFRVREGKYRSRVKVLETLAAGTTEENEIVTNKLEHMKLEKARVEERERSEEKDVLQLKKAKEHSDAEIHRLKQELEMVKKTHEKHCLKLETNSQKVKVELEKKLEDAELRMVDSRKKVKELEKLCESKSKKWGRKEDTYQCFMDSHSGALQELKATSESLKHEVLKTKRNYIQDLNYFGFKLRGIADAAKNYHVVLDENRRLYNEVQELKGNIRVYCRIRPFLPGQNKKQTTIEYIGENGELMVVNPLKQGKDSHRLFKFNKVFSPTATQEEVFLDTQPLIRSVLDGYNVCIFAYGQTGSGKTYTMSGPNITSKEDWGVNYRALNDLFQLSQSRQNSVTYEVGVQMVEIYNELVRDLLSNSASNRRLGIWNTAQPNGLAVPDASLHCVGSTEDVLELMNIGLMNRAVGATALNERSSRSHSVLTVHVRGVDADTDSVLRGSLHLVDLAGSERVDRSEATGDRLKEAQHINKSLSALGDVISALAQKTPHVPYRNSKLTQVLQSSLGRQAKTLMFVQINPDVESYSETISTLKFAERVSGVELGAARSNKEGRDVRHLMEQVSTLKDVIAKKDEEIEKLQQLKDNASILKPRGLSNRSHGSQSPRRHSSVGASPRAQQGQGLGLFGRATFDADDCSEYSDKPSDSGSQLSTDEQSHQRSFHASQSKVAGGKLLGHEDGVSEEKLSDISYGCLSMGKETNGSISNAVELTLFPETARLAGKAESEKHERTEKLEKLVKLEKSEKHEKAGKAKQNDQTNLQSRLMKHAMKPIQTKASRLSMATSASSSKALAGAKKPVMGSTSAGKPLNRQR